MSRDAAQWKRLRDASAGAPTRHRRLSQVQLVLRLLERPAATTLQVPGKQWRTYRPGMVDKSVEGVEATMLDTSAAR